MTDDEYLDKGPYLDNFLVQGALRGMHKAKMTRDIAKTDLEECRAKSGTDLDLLELRHLTREYQMAATVYNELKQYAVDVIKRKIRSDFYGL